MVIFDELPCLSFINRIGDERAIVAYMHIENTLKHEQHTTLRSDETRKHGDVYEIFALRDNEQKEWVLGLKNMKDKSSNTCLNTLQTVVDDILSCILWETNHPT